MYLLSEMIFLIVWDIYFLDVIDRNFIRLVVIFMFF